jgi:hypothetical protein
MLGNLLSMDAAVTEKKRGNAAQDAEPEENRHGTAGGTSCLFCSGPKILAHSCLPLLAASRMLDRLHFLCCDVGIPRFRYSIEHGLDRIKLTICIGTYNNT